MPLLRRPIRAALAVCCLLALAAPAAASVRSGAAPTYKITFEFEGLSGVPGKACHGKGLFGEMKRGAKVTISERVASGDFQVLAKGKVRAGKVAEAKDGEKVCRMRSTVKTKRGPADDSRIYFEVKGVTFDISWPATDVADGDLGTWRCEFSDNSCAELVGGG